MLETLNILEGYDVPSWGHNSADYLHHLIEAVKLASADRLAYAYTDGVPIAGLLSKRYADSQRARIDPKRAAVSEGERTVQPIYRQAMAARAEAAPAPTPVEPGSVEVRSTVSMTVEVSEK